MALVKSYMLVTAVFSYIFSLKMLARNLNPMGSPFSIFDPGVDVSRESVGRVVMFRSGFTGSLMLHIDHREIGFGVVHCGAVDVASNASLLSIAQRYCQIERRAGVGYRNEFVWWHRTIANKGRSEARH